MLANEYLSGTQPSLDLWLLGLNTQRQTTEKECYVEVLEFHHARCLNRSNSDFT